MRIALISFEFPPSVAIGGIGTYAWEAAKMLASGGCDVEVFAAGETGDEPASKFGVRVHRFDVKDRAALRAAIRPCFAKRHQQNPFDLLESPEIGAEGAEVAAAFPEIATVVKLHTPTYLVGEIGYEAPGLMKRMRFSLGALRRGRLAKLKQKRYDADADLECCFARQAHEVAAPSIAIGERVGKDWSLASTRIKTYPYPFAPSPKLLELPLPTNVQTVGFLGRLEARKGVVEFARAIPNILKRAPELRFRFIGPSWPYLGSDMEVWIRRHCRGFLDQIEFVGPVSPINLPGQLQKLDVIVLPSRWENFPFACWESLATGRAVIGSSAGGMADVIDPGGSGLLIPPRDPIALAKAVLSLAGRPEEVARLGAAGRKRVLNHLSPERVLPLQMASYERAIEGAKGRL